MVQSLLTFVVANNKKVRPYEGPESPLKDIQAAAKDYIQRITRILHVPRGDGVLVYPDQATIGRSSH